MRYLLALACLLIVPAETPADVVTFPGAVAEGYSAVSEVKGDLELPEAPVGGKLPVVLVLHGSGGIDGRGEFHRKALNAGRDWYVGDLHVFPRQSAPWYPRELYPHVWRIKVSGKPTGNRATAHWRNGFFVGRWALSRCSLG